MTLIQNGHRPKRTELPKAKITGINRNRSSVSLALQVKIEDRDHDVLLPIDAIEGYGMTGPAAVEEIRTIRMAIVALAETVGRLAQVAARPNL